MKKVEIGKAIGYGWESIKKDFWYFVAIAAIYLVISNISSAQKTEPSQFNIYGLLSLVISSYLTGGMMKIGLSYFDGKKVAITEMFTQYQYFFRVLGASILTCIIVILGLILLIVPGIIWGLKYQFAINLIVDKNIGIMEAMRQSAELTKGVKWQLFVFNLAVFGVMILGALVFGVGVLVAFPVVWLADIYVCRKLQQTQTA
jgi:uncharacterized membrane protein